ncbi:MAG TPA: hypothetical protein VFN67_02135 [Polyangiales bacterium]|nr:hypothetical protein [Polyangiales bacterium]
MPELVALAPALAAWDGLAIPLPAATAATDPPAAVGCIGALPCGVVDTVEVSAGAAASLHAITQHSSKTGDRAPKREESEGVSWIIGLRCESEPYRARSSTTTSEARQNNDCELPLAPSRQKPAARAYSGLS